MKKQVRTACLTLVSAAIGLGVTPALAQNVEQVKPVFDHPIPNAEGKSMIAVVVTYPPGAKSIGGPERKLRQIQLGAWTKTRPLDPISL